MHCKPTWHKRRVRWGMLIGFWVLVGLYYESMRVLAHVTVGEPFSIDEVLRGLMAWCVWVPATPVVFWIARRFPVERDTWRRVVPIHLAGAILTSLFATVLYHAVAWAFFLASGTGYEVIEHARSSFARYLGFDATIYVAIVTALHAFEYYRRLQERATQTRLLRAELSEAQLRALKMQLHPHFLFNTLNTVAMLVRRGRTEEATDMIARLSEFLRHTLDENTPQRLPLVEEIEFTRRYLEIEQVRFGDRLDIRISVDDDARCALVPNLLFQPLVENAVRHGLAPLRRPGRLTIDAWREGPLLRIRVQDDGVGLPEGWTAAAAPGIGLRNIKARLVKLYADRHRFALSSRAGGGVTVSLTLPFELRPGDDFPVGGEPGRMAALPSVPAVPAEPAPAKTPS